MNLLDKLDQFVKIKPWLQFVGYMLAFGGMIFIEDYPDPAKLVVYLGLGVSMAGFVYDMIYP